MSTKPSPRGIEIPMDAEPCESFIEPASTPDLIAVFERDGYLAYLEALPYPPPHRPALPPSQYDPRCEHGPLQDDPLWTSGDLWTHDEQGREITVGGLTGCW